MNHKRNTLVLVFLLAVIAPFVWAQEEASKIVGVNLTALLALGVVGATVIGGTVEQSDIEFIAEVDSETGSVVTDAVLVASTADM